MALLSPPTTSGFTSFRWHSYSQPRVVVTLAESPPGTRGPEPESPGILGLLAARAPCLPHPHTLLPAGASCRFSTASHCSLHPTPFSFHACWLRAPLLGSICCKSVLPHV